MTNSIFTDRRFSSVWLVLRVCVGWLWLSAGYRKVTSGLWVGEKAGVALRGYLTGALTKHPDVSGLYASFISGFVLHNTVAFSYLVCFGELLVGIGLITGAFTGISAFFGGFMNVNYILAGTMSINPLMFLAELLLFLAWRTAGWYGMDRYLKKLFRF